MDLESVLKQLESEGIPETIDRKHKLRTKESAILKAEFGKPYHLCIVMLTQGLIPGPSRQVDIMKFLNERGCDMTNQKINNDLTFAIRKFDIAQFIDPDFKGIKKIDALSDWHGTCCFCFKTYEPDGRTKAACHECMGVKPLSKTKKTCACGNKFYETALNGHLCQACVVRNKQHSESTINVYYSGVM